MGVVYLAEDPVIGRKLAIKVIHDHADLDDEGRAESRARFQREFRLAGTLKHPNIVTIFDVGQEEDAGFIAMELVEGPSLARRMSSGDLSTKEALQVAREIGSALDYAHARGVVHRDIKPANILIDGHGHAKLADFGIAKLAANDLTATGTVMGTPWYLPPENLTGGVACPASDQYSLATILYEILVGARPYLAESTSSVLYKIVHEAPIDPLQANPDLPEGVAQVLLTALEKRPEDRFSSCAEFVRALGEAAEPGSSAAAPQVLPRKPAPSPAARTKESLSIGSGKWADNAVTILSRIAEQRWLLASGLFLLLIVTATGWITLGGGEFFSRPSEQAVPGQEMPEKLELVLAVDSTPPGAEIWLDGESMNRTTPSEISLSGFRGESLVVELRHEDRVLARQQFLLGDEMEQVWRAELALETLAASGLRDDSEAGRRVRGSDTPPSGRIRVETRPAGAVLMLGDHAAKGRTPLEIDTPEEGTVLWVHAPKHASQSWTFRAGALSAMEIRERTLFFSLTPALFPGRLERKVKTLRAGVKIERPALLYEVDPGMPPKRNGKRAMGTVILGLILDVNGYVASVEVLRGVDPELDRLAIEAMEIRRYAKSDYRNRPVQVELTATIRFEEGRGGSLR